MKRIKIMNDVRVYLEGFGVITFQEDGDRWRMELTGGEQNLDNLLMPRPIKGGGTFYTSVKNVLTEYDL